MDFTSALGELLTESDGIGGERRNDRRYSLRLELKWKASLRRRLLNTGTGHTAALSSGGILLDAGRHNGTVTSALQLSRIYRAPRLPMTASTGGAGGGEGGVGSTGFFGFWSSRCATKSLRALVYLGVPGVPGTVAHSSGVISCTVT